MSALPTLWVVGWCLGFEALCLELWLKRALVRGNCSREDLEKKKKKNKKIK